MDFLTTKFLILLFVTAVVNYIAPKAYRAAGLLASSLVFYYLGARAFFPLLLALCLATYLLGLLVERLKKPYMYAIGAFTILALLGYFKYAAFFISTVDRLLNLAEGETILSLGDVIAPLGISFMTFQSISYLGDICHGKIKAERNPVPVALQVCFFPNVISGPIQKARTFLPQVKEKAAFDETGIRHGLLLFAFGGLQKYYLSDKLAPMIQSMQEEIAAREPLGGLQFIFFAFCYALYIYANFNSYSDMAVGIAQILGIHFGENFRRPYLSQTIREFWQRWHISLNSWFVEYVYIPLGGSRKGKVRYYLNILIVFLLSGLWHGAGMHFVVWGLLNGIYQIAGDLTAAGRSKLCRRLKINPEKPLIIWWKRLCVFCLISLTWVFFAIPDIGTAIHMVREIFRPAINYASARWILVQIGSWMELIRMAVRVALFAGIQLLREKRSAGELLAKQPAVLRYVIYAVMTAFLIFGYTGTFTGLGNGGFIYANF